MVTEIAAKFTKEEFNTWKYNPITKYLDKKIESRIQQILETTIDLIFNDASLLTPLEQHTYNMGVIEGLKIIRQIDFNENDSEEDI